MLLGIDEVGRGSLAGPLVVGAVVLGGSIIDGLTDSKLLTKKRREELYTEIVAKAEAFGLGWVTAKEIDEIGLAAALRLATIRAVEQIKVPYHEIIIDGTVNFLADTNKGKYVKTLKKADLLIPCVSAASIIAKVERDRYMTAKNDEYPRYGFDKHVGYGTKKHLEAIGEVGPTLLHRKSFEPIKSQLISATTKLKGDCAEDVAEQYLKIKGHEIINRNWRTKSCEIDIISIFRRTIYFTEVKYRQSNRQGDGFEAITNKKLNQMKYAVKYYMTVNDVDNLTPRLTVVSLSGEPPVIDDYLEIQ